MTNLISNGKVTSFTGMPSISRQGKWIPVTSNSIHMYSSILVKVDSKIFVCENVTIIWTPSGVDFISDYEIQLTKHSTTDHTKTIKKIKKFLKEYEGKFQIGLDYKDLEMYYQLKAAYDKYRLLSYFKLEVDKGGEYA